MAIFYSDSGSLRDLKVTGSTLMTASTGIALQVKSSGSTIFSVSGSGGEIFNISDVGSSTALFTVASGSTNILNVDNTKAVSVSGSLVVTGSAYIRGLGTTAQTSVVTIDTSTGQLYTTASSAVGGGGSSAPLSYIATGSVTASVNVGSTMFQITSASVTRTSMTNLGIQTWVLNNGTNEAGVIAYSTPQSSPGIIFGTSGSSIDTSTFLNRFNFANAGTYTYLGYGGATVLGSFALFSGSNNINIGYTGTPTDTGYRLLVSGSGISGSFNANNTLYVSASNVGIGTTTPTAKLEISASATNTTPSLLISNIPIGYSEILVITGSRGKLLGFDADSNEAHFSIKANQSNIFAFEITASASDNYIRGRGYRNLYLDHYGGLFVTQSGGWNNGPIAFQITNTGISPTPLFQIDSGSVRANRSLIVSASALNLSQSYTVDISGNGTSGSFNANNVLYVTGSRVGISSSAPNTTLDVNGWINTNEGVSFDGTSWTNGVPASGGKILATGSGLRYSFESGQGYTHDFRTNDFSRMFINDVGVGIGTVPTYSLHIKTYAGSNPPSGTLNVNDVLFVSASNVGIGVSNPTGALHVAIGGGTEFQVQSTGTRIGNAITDTHTVTGSFNISGSTYLGGNVTGTGSSFEYFISSSGITGSSFKINQSATALNESLTFKFGPYNVEVNKETTNTASFHFGGRNTGLSFLGSQPYMTGTPLFIWGAGSTGPNNISRMLMGVNSTTEYTSGPTYPSGSSNYFYINTVFSSPNPANVERRPLYIGAKEIGLFSGGSNNSESFSRTPEMFISASGEVTINTVLVLPFQSPLPSGKPTASIALSGSGGTFEGMYVYNGTSWTKVGP